MNVSFTLIFFFTGIFDFIGEFLTDHFGRKPIYVMLTIIQLMAYTIGLTAHSYWLISFSNALIISGVSLNYSLLIVFVSESFPARTRNRASIYLFLFEVGGYISFTVFEIFQVNYIHIYWLGLIPTLFILLFSFKMQETLFYQ